MFTKEISIIIPTKNRPKLLIVTVEKAVEAIGSLPIEIIVVNDGETLPNISQISCTLRFFNNPYRGVASARNYGVKQSNGRILFFIDDDMWINRPGLEWILKNFSFDENEKFVFNLNWEYPSELQKKLLNSKMGRYILANNYNTLWGRMHAVGVRPSSGRYKFSHIGSGSLVMKRDTFNFIGGYNEDFIFAGEDIEFSNRLNKHQIPIFCVFDITLFHNHSDRLDLDGHLDRESRGLHSLFTAEIMGLIPKSPHNYLGLNGVLFRFVHLNEKFLIFMINVLPDYSFFIKLTNRLIGILTSLQGYKEWRKVYRKF